MASPEILRRRLTLCAIIGIIAVVIVFVVTQRKPASIEETPSVFNLPPVRPSEFSNAEPGVEYVGADVCAECHDEIHANWLNTAHHLALAEVDPEHEPPVGDFFDESSSRQYRISVRDGQMWHSETLVTQQGTELPLAEHAVRYVMGSGRFSRSYLIEDDGFLMESPCTWYSARPGWALSPGYEVFNPGFERPAEVRCVACHTGRAEPIENSPHRLAIVTQAIDCEKCHGPGELHAQLRDGSAIVDEPDETIAHPGRLPRERAEAICARCHFHSDASVLVRGRRLDDFRPGMALEDFQVHYGFDSGNEQMTVVGHFEQMRLSACYQNSQEFTCTTCHDPHQRLDSASAQEFVRQQCIGCHSPESCGVPVPDRLISQPDDHCAQCHMPQTPTEILHFAFTHHRVAVHDPPGTQRETLAANDSNPAPSLRPLDDLSWMPEVDQQRCLGLAYVEVLDNPDHAQHVELFRQRTIQILQDVHTEGLADPDVDAALARLHFGRNHSIAMRYAASSALDGDSPSPDAESGALFVLANALLELDRVDEALPYLQRVVQLRRHAGAWHLLSLAHEQQGQLPQALDAALQAAHVSPANSEAANHVAELYRKSGELDQADAFAERARRLAEFEPRR